MTFHFKQVIRANSSAEEEDGAKFQRGGGRKIVHQPTTSIVPIFTNPKFVCTQPPHTHAFPHSAQSSTRVYTLIHF